jgi:sulfhydrogenase subunit beta (sulfur reductase)
MKETGFLPKGKEKEFLGHLAQKARVFAPCEEGGVVLFRPYDPARTLCLTRPANASPKGVIFPQNEVLFGFSYEKDSEDPKKTSIQLDAKMTVPETIIFGGRPCDAKGFTVYDRVYINPDYPDPYYRERREKTSIVTLSCSAPSEGCFCVAVGGGPADTEGSDVLMTEVEQGYFLQALTDKGKVILETPLVEDGAKHRDAAGKKQEAVKKAVKNPFGEDGSAKVLPEVFEKDEFWQETTERCISCGACTFLCPTCYCFNITDEQVTNRGERIRSWDACMFQHFTLEGSGHNPRPLRQQRFRNRVGHKFVYYPEKYNGVIACCGCGRCIRYCPVSIDISEVVSALGVEPAVQSTKNE